jgi:hypothetical protein
MPGIGRAEAGRARPTDARRPGERTSPGGHEMAQRIGDETPKVDTETPPRLR